MLDWFKQAETGEAGCLVVAEIAQTHDGSLGTAHAYIDAVANAGADAIKFQTHIAAAESTPGEPWRVKFSGGIPAPKFCLSAPSRESRRGLYRRKVFR